MKKAIVITPIKAILRNWDNLIYEFELKTHAQGKKELIDAMAEDWVILD